MFNPDEDILNILTFEGSYDDQIIDESDHDLQLKQKLNEKHIPKYVVKLEDFYDIKDRFKKVTNVKLQSSNLRFELVNLIIDTKLKNVNLGLGLSPNEIFAFI